MYVYMYIYIYIYIDVGRVAQSVSRVALNSIMERKSVLFRVGRV